MAFEKEYVKLVEESILYHYERFDGNGYPDGISIGSLSIITSVISICDVCSVLLSNRCYKPAYFSEEALEILEKEKGKQFNFRKNKCFINKERMDTYPFFFKVNF